MQTNFFMSDSVWYYATYYFVVTLCGNPNTYSVSYCPGPFMYGGNDN